MPALRGNRFAGLGIVIAATLMAAGSVPHAQQPQAGAVQQPAPIAGKPSLPVERIGDKLFRVGPIQVDTAKREVSVPGRINDVTVLEFVANTRQGAKAYESAMTLDTDAITFNAALLLIGLDPAHAVVPTRHFDPVPPKGDPVELWVEVAGPPSQRIRAERLIYDAGTKKTMADGPWVYTGSSFVKNSEGGNTYLADQDGVLIGFVHSPAPIIENPRGAGIGQYGSVVLNPTLGLKPLTPVKLIIKALDK